MTLFNVIVGGLVSIIIFLLLVLVYFAVTKPKRYRARDEIFNLDTLADMPPFKSILRVLIPKEDDREYIKTVKLINDSGINISIKAIYFFKLVLPIIILGIVSAVYVTYKEEFISAIINDSISQRMEVFATGVAKNEQREIEKAREREVDRRAFTAVEKSLKTQLPTLSEVEATSQIREILKEEQFYNDTTLNEKISVIFEKVKKVELARKANMGTFMFIFMLSAIGFIIPDWYLKVAAFMRRQAHDNEVTALEMLVILVGTVENITVKEILKILRDNSNSYKPNLEKCLAEYPTDFEKALLDLANSVNNKDFKALIMTLRQCATSDKYQSLVALKRRRLSRKEFRKLQEEKKIEAKSFIGLALLAPSLFLLAKLMLAPWQDLLNFNVNL